MKDALIDTYNTQLIQQYLSDTKRDMEVGGFPRCTDELVSDMMVSYLSPHSELTKSQYLCAIALIYSLQQDTLQLSSRKFVDDYLCHQHPWNISMIDVSGIMLVISYLNVTSVGHRQLMPQLRKTLEQTYEIEWNDFQLAAYVFDTVVVNIDSTEVYEWMQFSDKVTVTPSTECIPNKEVVVLCGPSSSGKTTFTDHVYPQSHYNTFSLDKCRLAWYLDSTQPVNEETYRSEFEASCTDKEFQHKVDARLDVMVRQLLDTPNETVLVIDNMSLTSKSRKKLYNVVKRIGNITVTCLLFQTSLQTIIDRNAQRGDRGMNKGIVINMYNNLTHPLLDVECDKIGTVNYHARS